MPVRRVYERTTKVGYSQTLEACAVYTDTALQNCPMTRAKLPFFFPSLQWGWQNSGTVLEICLTILARTKVGIYSDRER